MVLFLREGFSKVGQMAFVEGKWMWLFDESWYFIDNLDILTKWSNLKNIWEIISVYAVQSTFNTLYVRNWTSEHAHFELLSSFGKWKSEEKSSPFFEGTVWEITSELKTKCFLPLLGPLNDLCFRWNRPLCCCCSYEFSYEFSSLCS